MSCAKAPTIRSTASTPLMIPVDRHNEFTNRYAQDVYRECEAKLGRRWWR